MDFDTSQSNYERTFVKIWKMPPKEDSKLSNILGGQALSWIERDAKDLRVLRICSLTEFYNAGTDMCEPCSR